MAIATPINWRSIGRDGIWPWASFRDPDTRALFVVDHPAYDHMAAISGDVRDALVGDFD